MVTTQISKLLNYLVTTKVQLETHPGVIVFLTDP